ncbi:MAG: hypothetical protein HY882_13070 [Deltaproteobacteria bacterium]|nr:hypothetical protein [Deltaproteobacteria bacterium]
MNTDQALKLLESQVRVTPQQVMIAKGYIMNHFDPDTPAVIKGFLKSVEAATPEKLVIHLTVDTKESIKSVAETLSWTLAGSEAIWGLISSGLLFPGSSELRSFMPNVNYSTVIQGSGNSGALDLNHLVLAVPTRVLLPPSTARGEPQTLTDPDLFLHSLGIPYIEKEVEESLRESVRCFKHELFLACLAMLGRASEGAWIELGLALCAIAPSSAPINITKTKEKLEDPFVGIGKKILETARLYQRTDLFGDLHKTCGVKPQDLDNVTVWADAVRESRNSVHYGAEPSMPNTYEKIAALLIGAVPHLRLLYRIRAAVKSAVGKSNVNW